ncbi:MAG: GNAT family N-acetyltransferase [Chloroflexota bacterium]
MLISEVELSQLKELAAFARRTYIDAYADGLSPQMLQDHLAHHLSDGRFNEMAQVDTFYVAYTEGKLVGFVQIGVVEEGYKNFVTAFESKAAEIRRLYVAKENQNHGIGLALLLRALNDSTVNQSRCVYITTWEANDGALRLYQRYGFAKVGEIPEYGPDGNLNGYEHVLAGSI